MSHGYYIVCVDCGVVLDLGKIVDMDETGKTLPIQFFGWQDVETNEHVQGNILWEYIQRFFIIHRGHEIRIVSESFLNETDPEGFLTYIDTKKDLFDEKFSIPDDIEDASKVPDSVKEKLRKAFRENSF